MEKYQTLLLIAISFFVGMRIGWKVKTYYSEKPMPEKPMPIVFNKICPCKSCISGYGSISCSEKDGQKLITCHESCERYIQWSKG
jgi:hypothetical protein